MTPTGTAMEIAVAGAADLGRYGRRIVKMLWDPEPTNNARDNQPVWCLGHSYALEPSKRKSAISRDDVSPTTPPPDIDSTTSPPSMLVPDTPPDSTSSSFSSSLVFDEYEDSDDGGWPTAFLDDFESRFWMTYRSGFEPIARPVDPKASTTMSFTMKLKTLGDQSGFSSDSGWGCMIRSGQSLLANAMAMYELGRGKLPSYFCLWMQSP